jgi:hypothetical protein
VGGGFDGKSDHIIRGSLLCEPKRRKPDQVIIDDLVGLYRSTGLVARMHMHMYVPWVSRVGEKVKNKVSHTIGVYPDIGHILVCVYI